MRSVRYLVFTFFLCLSLAVPILAAPPADPVVYGTGWIIGTNSRIGEITVYLPSDFIDSGLGVDSFGNVINTSTTSFSAYCDSPKIYNNNINFPKFSYPYYRDPSTHDEYDLHLKIVDSNCNIATELAPRVSAGSILPYVSITLLGVIFLCCLRKR